MRRFPFVLLVLFLFSTYAGAQIHVAPTHTYTNADKTLSGFFVSENIEYESENNNQDYEVNRKVLGVGIASNINADFQAFGQFTFAPSIDYPNSGTGNGYSFGGGFRGIFDRTTNGLIFFGGALTYLKDDIEQEVAGTKINADFEITELALQATYATKIGQKVWGYGTMEILPMMDGEISFSPGGKADIERDDIIRLKFGANFYTNSLAIRPELALVGGQSFTIAVAKPM